MNRLNCRTPVVSFQSEEKSLNILKQLQKAERVMEKEAHKIGRELDGLRNAMAALGHKGKKIMLAKPKSRMSGKGRAKIAAAQKKRWAKIRAAKKKAA
jgi:hypothetical protein